MKTVILRVEDYLYEFYRKIGENAGGMETERVMEDALFRLAGGLSVQAAKEKKEKKERR